MRARRSSTLVALPTVRIDCSPWPSAPRPPGLLRFRVRIWFCTSTAVIPSAISRAGSRLTRISRSTPPTRLTRLTPGIDSSALATVSSMNQLVCSTVMAGERTV